MKYERTAGVLLHPSSLPSLFGIGDFGPEAMKFIDFLHQIKFSWWQTLPLNPPGFGESPYQCFSAFAINPMFISPELLHQNKLLSDSEIKNIPAFNKVKVDFEKVKPFKMDLLQKAFNRFKIRRKPNDWDFFINDNEYWLNDYCVFSAIKEYFNQSSWQTWEENIANREPGIVEYYEGLLYEEIEFHQFLQYTAFQQWSALKAYANNLDIRLMGDLPIFVSSDSSDTWSKKEYFELDEKGIPLKIAGVPPDYFSKTGQLWGNPHYIWNKMKEDDFQWWRERLALLLKTNDAIRIDHFRGFESYWEIEGGAKNAIEGSWVKAPGRELFESIRKHMGDLPIIAEDLGIITPEVNQLKESQGFPGMKILQFAFGNASETRFLPDSYEKKSIVYTGTHDNDTSIGYYHHLMEESPEAFQKMLEMLDLTVEDGEKSFCWHLIQTAFSSNSMIAIIPMQDILNLGTENRMNTPGTTEGNWRFRFQWNQLHHDQEERIRTLIKRTGRHK